MKTSKILVLAAAMCAVIYSVATTPPSERGRLVTPACAQGQVIARESVIGGEQVGEVVVDNQVVFRIRTSTVNQTPYQRAQVVAGRLNRLISNGQLRPETITTGVYNREYVVVANSQIIITADPAEARANHVSTSELANTWARQLENAVAGRNVTETPVSQKVVPIISVGSGTRIGAALVTGGRGQVARVVAVAQIEGNFGNSVRVRALIPVSTTNVVQNISRVAGTSVIGLVDIKL